MTRPETMQRALEALTAVGVAQHEAQRLLGALSLAGIELADDRDDELVVRWVDAQLRAVPPDADTIIRTITTTTAERVSSTTHWLDGLRSPRS